MNGKNDDPRFAEVLLEDWGAVVSGQLAVLDRAFLAAPEEDRLYGYAAALAYVVNALKSYPGFDGGTVILDDLLLQLTDIMAGTPALRPVKRTGRPKQGWRDAMTQGKAAAAVDFLMQHGESEPDACGVVAGALQRAGVKGRRGESVTAATVRDWRSRAAPYGDKEDALHIRGGFEILARMVPAADLSKGQLRRFVAAVISGGVELRQPSD